MIRFTSRLWLCTRRSDQLQNCTNISENRTQLNRLKGKIDAGTTIFNRKSLFVAEKKRLTSALGSRMSLCCPSQLNELGLVHMVLIPV